jgi:hypothetical protein
MGSARTVDATPFVPADADLGSENRDELRRGFAADVAAFAGAVAR